jgi:hypothetical protein
MQVKMVLADSLNSKLSAHEVIFLTGQSGIIISIPETLNLSMKITKGMRDDANLCGIGQSEDSTDLGIHFGRSREIPPISRES